VGQRVLVTGIDSFWGGRVAQALERSPDIDVIVGLGTSEPQVELERTEFVRSDESYSILTRIVRAVQVDTILHTSLVTDSTQMPSHQLHEVNVIGTMNLFAAAGQEGSGVRNVIVTSSTLVYGSTHRDPVWFTEDTPRSQRPRTPLEQSLVEVESYVRDYAIDFPDVTVTLLRLSHVLGPDVVTPITRALRLPLVPVVFGYDPRLQFVHEADVARAIMFVLEKRLAGTYNVAADGLLPWSEVISMCGKQPLPLPPFGTGVTATVLARLGIDLPPEMIRLLTYGLGADNRRLKQAGFGYGHTSAGAVQAFAQDLRLRRFVGSTESSYSYDRDVEQFFRYSPAVVRDT
jgi:UDP-glucose 4-epimerase